MKKLLCRTQICMFVKLHRSIGNGLGTRIKALKPPETHTRKDTQLSDFIADHCKAVLLLRLALFPLGLYLTMENFPVMLGGLDEQCSFFIAFAEHLQL